MGIFTSGSPFPLPSIRCLPLPHFILSHKDAIRYGAENCGETYMVSHIVHCETASGGPKNDGSADILGWRRGLVGHKAYLCRYERRQDT